MFGFRTRSWRPFRNVGQLVIGGSLGLYFSPEIGQLILSLWWVIVLSILWALLVGAGFGNVLYRLHGQEIPGLTRSACFFSGAIGGASEMTNLAEREKGRTDLVAAAHSLRVMLIAIVIPFGLKALGFQGNPVLGPVAKDIVPLGLALMFGLALGPGALGPSQSLVFRRFGGLDGFVLEWSHLNGSAHLDDQCVSTLDWYQFGRSVFWGLHQIRPQVDVERRHWDDEFDWCVLFICAWHLQTLRH
jgi:membrane AbrB-like protein